MKRFKSFLILLSLIMLAACSPRNGQEASAQDSTGSDLSTFHARAGNEAKASPNAVVTQTLGTTVVTISYGRPGVKGRTVFGQLEPFGEIWRAGANEATVISFTSDVKINGEPLAAGAYAFFAIPREEGQWTLIFNAVPNQWGAYRYDESQDALRVEVMPEQAPHMEWLAFYFDELTATSGEAVLHWATTRVPFTISVE